MKKILIISLQGLGNSILNTNLLIGLSKKYNIDLLVSDKLQKDFFSQLNIFNRVITKKEYSHVFYKLKYDEAYTLYPNWKRENFYLFITRARKKKSFINKDLRYFFKFLYFLNIFTDSIAATKAIGNNDLENNTLLFNDCNQIDQKVLYNLVESYNLENKKNICLLKNYIIIHATSSSKYKRIKGKEFAKTIDYFNQQNYNVILVGIKSERKINEEIRSQVEDKNRVFIYDELSLVETLYFLYHSKYFIGLDSAVAHMAALFSIPSIVIWSFANLERIYPYNKNLKILYSQKIKKMGLYSNYDDSNNDILKNEMNKVTHDKIIGLYRDLYIPNSLIKSQNDFEVKIYDINNLNFI